jgi:ubiquinol-cytochrome c reductase core subunit 2
LKTARETELYGGILSASLSREHLFLTADFLRGDESVLRFPFLCALNFRRAHFLEVLASVLSSTHFHAHEYAELVLPTVQSEALAALASPTTLALDLAHGLAFRRGLGNSLFASPHSPVSANDAKSYARQAFSKSNLAVLGTGISTDALGKAVQSAFGSGSSSSPTLSSGSSEYFGGEQRVPLDLHSGPSAQPTMVIAYGSAGAATPEMKVLPYIMGGDSSVKWNPGTSQLSLKTAEIPGATAQSFIMPYSDASLFGVIISAPTSEGLRDLAKVVVADVSSVQSGKIGKAIVKRSVAKAKFADATGLERADTMLSVAGPAVRILLEDRTKLIICSDLHRRCSRSKRLFRCI